MSFLKYGIILICFVLTLCHSKTYHIQRFSHLNIYIRIEDDIINNAIKYTIVRVATPIQTITIDGSITKENIRITNDQNGFTIGTNNNSTSIRFSIIEDTQNAAIINVSRIVSAATIHRDCLQLNSSEMSWYGGPQQKYQYWPIEKLTFNDYAYVSKELDNCGITERYWLNSYGVYIYVDERTPLFLEQNQSGNDLCLIAKQQLPYNRKSLEFPFNYYIGINRINARTAHLHAINNFLQLPKGGYPDERMVQYPIWSTWARYKRDVNETVVLDFAKEINGNQFKNSQYELDDNWEICYGSLTFNTNKFPNIKQLTDTLKQMDFRVTLWIHPFINKMCEPWFTEAKNKGYLVHDEYNNTDTKWWNGETMGDAAYIDFTNRDAAQWFENRLIALQASAGIDSFKFDAGESSWSPSNPILTGDLHMHPSLITSDYVRTVAKFGSMVEVRSGQHTQDLSIFVRMIDKDSEWNWNNGLPTLVTTLLQLNMVGYPFVLPDMIGGNGYNNHSPNKEMFIRWLQANVFMPSLQFSYVPWDYDDETIALSHTFTDLHAAHTTEIMNRFKVAVKTGDPVNPPLWWISPNDRVAQQIYDQFLLGENIISAPVLNEGQTTRNIYLPIGKWLDKNTQIIHVGPKWLMDYPAPLQILPYFIRA